MKLFNSLTKQIEEFAPINRDGVGVYTCGPTVYDYVTIGNWRTYTLGDLTVRTLKYLGYTVNYVMNITDVGHLTGDNLGDADTGEDRLEKASKRENKTAWDIAEFYADDFRAGFNKLNLTLPNQLKKPHDHQGHFCKATDFIPEQIAMVQQIQANGFAYTIADGIYFDTEAFETAGYSYGELSNIDQVKEGARVEPNPDKKNPRDFALWKFSPKDEQRQMEWDSPWGVGFPGWHIECSAMSISQLGQPFDLHLGGEDLRSTHHPNEVAQVLAATGKPFVRLWMHGAFLQVNGGRMGKSLGNAYTIQDLERHGVDPLALRYFYLTGHYRKPLNFTWESLESAGNALKNLYERSVVFGSDTKNQMSNSVPSKSVVNTIEAFKQALAEDLNFPQALAVLHTGLDHTTNSFDTQFLLAEVDQVLGFDFKGRGTALYHEMQKGSEKFRDLLEQRQQLKAAKQYEDADKIRKEIEVAGFSIEDTPKGPILKKIIDSR